MNNKSSNFDLAYSKLNKEQKEAVDSIEGPVMVIAGPGTGKTQILTLRIANILKKTQTDPESILALTFTDSGVRAMRERLVEFIGPTGYQVDIFTFHSFCKRIIEDNSDDFNFRGESELLTDIERIEIFRYLIDSLDLRKLKSSRTKYYYMNSIIATISALKRELITPIKFLQLVNKSQEQLNSETEINPKTGRVKSKYLDWAAEIEKQFDLHKLYIGYEEQLDKRNRYDFDDMITFVVDSFKENDDLLAKYQERYQYILSDEYQDTNNSQNEVIRLLTSFEYLANPNVFVVGDDEQSIYRFQGASIENFQFFETNYPGVKKISLITNYRSTQAILDCSRSVISRNLTKIDGVEKKLDAFRNFENKEIAIAKFSNDISEKYFLVKTIRDLLKNGAKPSEIAVLYRKNSDGLELADSFAKFGLNCQVVRGENVLDDFEIKKLINILQIIFEAESEFRNLLQYDFWGNCEDNNKDLNLFSVMHYDLWGIDGTDILKLVKFASDNKKHLADVLSDGTFEKKSELNTSENIVRFWTNITSWRKVSKEEPFIKFLETVIKESGLLDKFLNSERGIDALNKLNKFFAELRNFNLANKNLTLLDFFETLKLREEYNISIPVDDITTAADAVQLMTAHKAKGLEFEHVFIVRCTNGDWGNVRDYKKIKLPKGVVKYSDLSKIEKNEDERRLFYVAMTRAKKRLFITFSAKYSNPWGEREKLPSQFINEIDNDLIEYVSTDEFENENVLESAMKTLLSTKSDDCKIKPTEEDFLKSELVNFSLSPTSLNTYLKCPYKYKLDKLFQIPRLKSIYSAFGSAVHKALEDLIRKYLMVKSFPKVEEVLQSFQMELRRQLLNKDDFETLLERGKTVLKEYYREILNRKLSFFCAEHSFNGRKIYLDDVRLSGKIDRVDWVDQDRREVCIVDYKTGRSKTKRQILGTTKDSDGDYKRQLVFYKLLAQLDRSFNKVVVATRLEFVEKDEKKDKFVNFEYRVADEDLKCLRQEIRETAKRIRSFEFPKTDETKNCRFCEYRAHCGRE